MFKIQSTGTRGLRILTKMIILQLGLKHLITQIFYGKLIAEYQKAINTGAIEKGSEISGKIPKGLFNSFQDLNSIVTSKKWG